jgi:hypothetical protein
MHIHPEEPYRCGLLENRHIYKGLSETALAGWHEQRAMCGILSGVSEYVRRQAWHGDDD